MSFFDYVITFFREGGPFLYLLAAIFVVGIAMGIERFIFLTAETTSNRRLWNQVAPLIANGNLPPLASRPPGASVPRQLPGVATTSRFAPPGSHPNGQHSSRSPSA